MASRKSDSEKTDAAAPTTSAPAVEADPAATGAISPERRDEFAAKIVDRFALWTGAAGVIPIPIVDLAAVGGLQLQMVRRLSQIYEVPFSENRGKALIASLAGSAIPTSSGLGAASMLKAVPFAGFIVSVLVVPALSGSATYAIGKAFMQHFSSGGTFLDFNPPDYREFIKAHKEMWSSSPGPAKANDQEAEPSAAAPSG